MVLANERSRDTDRMEISEGGKIMFSTGHFRSWTFLLVTLRIGFRDAYASKNWPTRSKQFYLVGKKIGRGTYINQDSDFKKYFQFSCSMPGNRGPAVLALTSERRYLYDNDGFRANDAGCFSVSGIH